MNYKAIIKKQSTVIAIAVICLAIATIGVSYALFFQVESNTKNQVVTAGTLDVSYGSGSSGITAKELIPMSDEEALTSNTMTGTIYLENKGTLPASYEIKLGNDNSSFEAREDYAETDELLSHEYLKIAAYVDGEQVLAPTILSTLTISSDDNTMYSIYNGEINVSGTGNNTATIIIKVWVSEDAPTDIIGDYVYLKMDVTGQVNDFLAGGGKYKSASGLIPLKLENSFGYNLIDYKLYGNSVQEGENLFSKENMTSGFLPMTGSYPTTNASYPNASYMIIDIKKGETLKITYEGDYASNWRIRYIDSDTDNVISNLTATSNNYFTSTIAGNLGINSGTITANKDFKIGLLYLQSMPDSGFSLNIVSVTPTPDAPIEVENIGEKTKNLFNKSKWANAIGETEVNGVKCLNVSERSTGYYIIPGDSSTAYTISMKIYRNTDYENGTNLKALQADGTVRHVFAIPLNERRIGTVYGGEKIYFSGWNRDDICIDLTATQLELGSTATDFEPYGYKIPVTVSGKNLFNTTEVSNIDNWTFNTTGDVGNYILNLPAGTYTISSEFIKLPSSSTLGIYKDTSTGSSTTVYSITNFKNNATKSVTLAEGDCLRFNVYFPEVNAAKHNIPKIFGEYIDKMLIYKGSYTEDTIPQYEPFIEPIITNIYLDEPLRKIDGVVDYIDFENKTLFRKVGKYSFKGTETFAISGTTTTESLVCYTDDIVPAPKKSGTSGLCNIGNVDLYDQIQSYNNGFFYNSNTMHFLKIQKSAITGYNDSLTDDEKVSVYKQYLSNKYTAGTPVTIFYELETPSETKIELPDIFAPKGNLILEVNTAVEPSNISVLYK